MSHEDDVKAFLADRPTAKVHQIDIIGGLPHIGPAAIESLLRSMSKRGVIAKVSKAVYQHKDEAQQPAASKQPPAAPWLADELAPYQRTRLFIEANGPPKKHALLNMLARFVNGSVRVLGAMVVEGAVHQTDDGRIALGRNPKMPAIPRYRDPARGPKPLPPAKNTPVEAEERREASAEAASEVQEAIATPTLAADEPDASAVGTTPAQEIGPAPVEPGITSFMRGEDLAAPTATVHVPYSVQTHRDLIDSLIAPKYEPHPDDANKHIVIEPKHHTFAVSRWDCRWPAARGLFETLAEIAAEERADRLLEESQQEDDMSEIQDTAPPVGANAQTPGTTPVATFHVELPGLHIAISGEAKAVMQAVTALEKTLAQ